MKTKMWTKIEDYIWDHDLALLAVVLVVISVNFAISTSILALLVWLGVMSFDMAFEVIVILPACMIMVEFMMFFLWKM